MSSDALERVAHGVYRVRGGETPEHLELRAAWLQLAPGTPASERTPEEDVVSHRSAGLLYNLGHLAADLHDFTLPVRRQTRRDDDRLRRLELENGELAIHRGLPVTKPARIAADLLDEREIPAAVGQLIADALRSGYESPRRFADAVGRTRRASA